jgi:hypothetical protein
MAHLMTFSRPDYIILNYRMISQYRIGEAVEGSGHGIIGDNFFGTCLQGLRKTTKDFVPGSPSPGLPDAKLDRCTLDCDFRLCAYSTHKNGNRKLIQHFGWRILDKECKIPRRSKSSG